MPWPPTIPPNNRANTTLQADLHPTDHNQISNALTDIVSQVNPSSWVTPTLSTGWVVPAGWLQPIQYRKIGDVVSIRGMAKSGTINATMFTLPVGFRPPIEFECIFDSWNGSAHVQGTLAITPNGDVIPRQGNSLGVSLHLDFSITA